MKNHKPPKETKAIAVVSDRSHRIRVKEIYDMNDEGIIINKGEMKALVEIKFLKYIK